MIEEKDVLKLVGKIYDAAVEPERWKDFLEELVRFMPFHSRATLFLHDTEALASDLLSYVWEQDHIDTYGAHYVTVNPWLPKHDNVPVGVPYLGNALLPAEEMAKTEFYNDWLRPQGIVPEGGPSIILDREGTRFMNLAVLSTDVSDCGDALDLLGVLRPHLQRAAHIHRQFRRMDYQKNAVEEAFNRLMIGAILIDVKGTVVYANRKATRLLKQGDSLTVDRSGRLRPVATGAGLELLRLIHHARVTGLSKGTHAGGTLALPRPGRLPLSLLVAPLNVGSVNLAGYEGAAVVFVSDPEDGVQPHPRQLEELFDLTPTEARVLSALTAGKSLEACAEEFGVSIHTVRSHLKSLFLKTGCQRQAELVSLVLSNPVFVAEAENSHGELTEEEHRR